MHSDGGIFFTLSRRTFPDEPRRQVSVKGENSAFRGEKGKTLASKENRSGTTKNSGKNAGKQGEVGTRRGQEGRRKVGRETESRAKQGARRAGGRERSRTRKQRAEAGGPSLPRRGSHRAPPRRHRSWPIFSVFMKNMASPLGVKNQMVSCIH